MTLRLALASLAALGAAACMRMWGGKLPLALWLPTGMLVLAALLIHHRHHLGSQLLARAVLWSNLVLGVLIATWDGGRDRPIAAVLAACTGGALLLIGRRGLDEAQARSFAPVAFRTTLFSMFLLALADLLGLGFFTTLIVEESARRAGQTVTPVLLCGLLAAGLVGLYRLRVWGVFVSALANVALAVCAGSGLLEFPVPLRIGFAVTATLGLALSTPVFLGLIRGRATASPAISRGGAWIAGLVVVGLVGLASAATFLDLSLGRNW